MNWIVIRSDIYRLQFSIRCVILIITHRTLTKTLTYHRPGDRSDFNTHKPVDDVVIATKCLQDRNTNIIAGTTVENKGKLILTEIFPSVQEHAGQKHKYNSWDDGGK